MPVPDSAHTELDMNRVPINVPDYTAEVFTYLPWRYGAGRIPLTGFGVKVKVKNFACGARISLLPALR